MDAKCPKCNKIAELSEDIEFVRCRCGYEASYSDYIEDMKERLINILNENI
ncbi:MAG: hypothetical protein QW416_00675 [Candidatus Nitrosocaldaceae archaeon]